MNLKVICQSSGEKSAGLANNAVQTIFMELLADDYLQIGFTSGAGSIAPGASVKLIN